MLLCFLIIFSSCKNKEQNEPEMVTSSKSYDKIEQLQWLLGNWTNLSIDQQSYESWSQINDSTLAAYSHTIVFNDTVFEENMVVQQQYNEVVLIVSVPNQNEEKPVTFNLLPVENKVFSFVNEQHDFPNKISYTNPVKDSIHAWVEGQIDSNYKKIDFYFKRGN